MITSWSEEEIGHEDWRRFEARRTEKTWNERQVLDICVQENDDAAAESSQNTPSGNFTDREAPSHVG